MNNTDMLDFSQPSTSHTLALSRAEQKKPRWTGSVFIC